MAKFQHKQINFKFVRNKSCLKSNIEYIKPKIEKQFNFNFLCDQTFHASDQKIDVYQYIYIHTPNRYVLK